MSRLRWPDSTNSVSEKPGTIHERLLPIIGVGPGMVNTTLNESVA